MASIITLAGIDEAISNLGYDRRDSPKYLLPHVIRQFYTDQDSVASLQSIDTDKLVKSLWRTGDDPKAIANRRRNYNSVKSAVNADLKRLYDEGRNPEGIVIGPDNTFDLSDEAKNEMLKFAKLSEPGQDAVDLKQIAGVLEAVEEELDASESAPSSKDKQAQEYLDRIRELLSSISQKSILGGPGPDVTGSGFPTAGSSEAAIEPDEALNGLDPEEALDEDAFSEALDEDAEDFEVVEELDEEAPLEGGQEEEEEAALESEEALDGSDLEEALDEDAFSEALDEDAEDFEVVEELDEEAPLEGGQEEEEEAALASEEALDGSDLEEALDEDELSEDLDEDAEDFEVVDELGEEGEPGSGESSADAGDSSDPHGLDDSGEITGALGDTGKEIEKKRLLAEEYDRSLAAMDRYYNQYLLIPEGDYPLGSEHPGRDERPGETVHLAAFYFGKFPVTNALFGLFVESTGYTTTAEKVGYGEVYYGRHQKTVDEHSGQARLLWNATIVSKVVKGAFWYQPQGPGSTIHKKRNHPAVQVSLEDAMAFAAWTGKRLPTESEWEAAARTARGHTLPWGDDWLKGMCNVEESQVGDTTPVDQFLNAENALGIADTLGNVMEWTMDHTDPSSPGRAESRLFMVKGGNWASGNGVRLSSRNRSEPGSHSNILGFRCVAY